MKHQKSKTRILTNQGRVLRPGILERYSIKSADLSGSQQVAEDPFSNTYGKYGLVEPLYNPTELITLSEVNVYHKRCCDQKALDVAGNGIRIVPTTEGKGNATNKKKLEEFFLQQVPRDTWYKGHLDFEHCGQASIELVRYNNNPKGEPKTCAHLPVHTLRIHKSKEKFMMERGTGKVWFKNITYEGEINNNTGQPLNEAEVDSPETLGQRANEVIYIVNHTPRSDFYGIPDSIPAIPAMYGDQGRATYNVSFFENYGIPTYAITITGDFDEGDRDEATGLTDLEFALQEQLQAIQSNPHSTMVISVPSKDGLTGESDVKVDFKPLSVDVKEASFRLYRMDNRDEIITAHGMDPYRIGVMVEGSMGGNTSIQSKKNYNFGTVQPRQQIWEDAINHHIVQGAFGISDWKFEFNPIDLEEAESELSMMERLFMMGVASPNQVIDACGDKFGLERIDHPAMDAHYLNGVPLDYQPEVPVEVVETLKSLRDGLLEAAYEDSNSPEDGGVGGRVIKKIRNTITS